jgi:putative ATP-dependent endonuclease of OLD family
MKIKKVKIENYKSFKGVFSIDLNENLNILVGDNEAGKSTILEAIHICLSGQLNGKYILNQLSQYLFNNEVEKDYIESLKTTNKLPPPHISIEVFIAGDNLPFFEGDGNSEQKKECCITFKIEFDDQYKEEYLQLINTGEVSTIPIEYYKIAWFSCAREAVTSRSIPIKSVLIDSSTTRFQNGSDVYISRIIRNDLEDKERVDVSQAYRKLKETFMAEDSILNINEKITQKANISNKSVKISVDLSTKDAWETSLITYLDDVPFHQIGKGEQCIVKTNLALGHKKAKESNLILIEEPENHLSHTKLNQFIYNIHTQCVDKQIIISTHNSFVANKLGLENLIFLNNKKTISLSDLSPKTKEFFKKLPGFETLRMILCQKAILVEGPSDELIFQKAYMDSNQGKLPIQEGYDVISVGLTFKRFLEIASKIEKDIAVITDNDEDYDNKITKKYKDYSTFPFIKICADDRNKLRTLEYQFTDANKNDLQKLCNVVEIDFKEYNTEEKIIQYLVNNKTNWALKVFSSDIELSYPDYILEAVRWCNEKK